MFETKRARNKLVSGLTTLVVMALVAFYLKAMLLPSGLPENLFTLEYWSGLATYVMKVLLGLAALFGVLSAIFLPLLYAMDRGHKWAAKGTDDS